MGIPGLLGALKSVTYPIHISQYRGLTVGVDAYCWLHRGAFSCGTELCTGVPTDKYVTFCMKRVNLLRGHEIEPIMVFDGASLPMKGSKHMERRRNRDSARSKGNAALAAGEAGAAAQHFSKAVAVTHEMAFKLIKELRRAGVKLIVAPYEADAQLAYLSRSGAVDVVITEDSDCLPYGCKKVLFKMDNEGLGQEIQLRNLAANTPLSLCNWKNGMFLDLCLLVGCDYITSAVKGLGIATAHKLVSKHRSLDKIIRAVDASKFTVPEGYWAQYKRARLTFRHHIIYDPKAEETKHLMPLGDTAKDMGDLGFLGCHLPPLVCEGVTSGRLKPTDHQPHERVEPLDPSHPCAAPSVPEKSIPQDICAPSHKSAVTEDAGVPELNRKERAQHVPLHPPAVLNRSDKAQGGADAWSRGSQARILSVPSALTGSFIDRPFSANKSTLAVTPFLASEESRQTHMGWGAAASDTWGLQDMHSSPGVPAFSGGWHGDTLGKAPSTREGCQIGAMHAGTEQSSNFPLGVDSEVARLSATQARGLDFTRRLEPDCASLAGAFSPVTQLAPRDSWPGEAPRESTLLHATGQPNVPQPLPPSTEEGGRMGLALDWGDQSQPEGLTTTGSTGIKSRDTIANCPIRDVGWGEADVRVRESVWAETCSEKERTDARLTRRRCPTGESASDDRPDRPQGLLLGRMGCNPPGVDVAPGLYTSRPENQGANGSGGHEANASSSVEVDTRQAVGALALTGPPDANRAKFVPSSAQNFHSTQVSPGLETLQRRRRRVCAPGDGMLGPPLALGWRGPANARQQHEGEHENEEAVDATTSPALEEKMPSQTEEDTQLWMVQSNALSQQNDSGTPSHRRDGDAAGEPKGISFFNRGLLDYRALPTRPALTASSTKQDPTVLPGRHRGADNVGNEGRPSATLSRRWTVPSTLSTSRDAESPLLRLLGPTGDSSWHSRQMGKGGSSQPLAKRARGTEFWDAQLMR